MTPYTCSDCERTVAAYLDGPLSEAEIAALEAHFAVCPECREAHEGLLQLGEELTNLGEAYTAGLAEIDVRDAVMSRLSEAGTAREPSNVHAFPGQSSRRSRPWLPFLLAAGLALGFWGMAHLWLTPPDTGDPGVAQAPEPTVHEETEPPPITVTERPREETETPREQMDRVRAAVPRTPAPLDQPAEEGEPERKELTLDDILALRRHAAVDEEARNELQRLASLAPEQARAILETGSPRAVVAASGALTSSEAEQHLLTAVGHLPEEPYAQFAAARNFATRDEMTPEESVIAESEAAALLELDPGNALSHYLMARLLLDSGDIEGALAMLASARELEYASGYAVEGAQFREEALRESGLAPGIARALAALTAGNEEYAFLYELGMDLLAYGDQYALAGDWQTARELYESVNRFGGQLEQGAAHSQERLAGLDMQREAIDGLQTAYEALGDEEAVFSLVDQTYQLVNSINEVREFFAAVDRLFAGDLETRELYWVFSTILEFGDLHLF